MGEDLVSMGRAVAFSHEAESLRAEGSGRVTTAAWHKTTAKTIDQLIAEIERLRAREAELVEALKECADSLEAEAVASYPDRDRYAIQRRRYERDMAPVNKARALTAARQEPSHG